MLDLDPRRAALVLMDFQNYGLHPRGYWAKQGVPGFPEGCYPAVGRAARVLAAAREHGLLVVHVAAAWREGSPEMNLRVPVFARGPGRAVQGSWDADFYEPVQPRRGEMVVHKRGIGAFVGTELDRFLRVRGADSVLLAGVATNWVVEATAFDAADLGYGVVVLADCSASVSPEMHAFAVEKVLPEVATMATAEEALAWLAAAGRGRAPAAGPP